VPVGFALRLAFGPNVAASSSPDLDGLLPLSECCDLAYHLPVLFPGIERLRSHHRTITTRGSDTANFNITFPDLHGASRTKPLNGDSSLSSPRADQTCLDRATALARSPGDPTILLARRFLHSPLPIASFSATSACRRRQSRHADLLWRGVNRPNRVAA